MYINIGEYIMSNFVNRDDNDWMLTDDYSSNCEIFTLLVMNEYTPLICQSCEHQSECQSIIDQMENGGQPLE